MKPLAITMGDPVGVGPEIIIRALIEGRFDACGRPLRVYGDVGVLRRAAALFGFDAGVEPGGKETLLRLGERSLAVRGVSALQVEALRWGRPDVEVGRAMAAYVEAALADCLADEAAGMVTCPINKAAINAAGIRFPGHTELLAERCGVEKVVMMLAGERLRVCLVTTHLAYREVPQRLSVDEILATLRITDRDLRARFGLERPHLAVAALNPHAGEQGLFGDEEARLIAPAVEAARADGIEVSGPHPPDTLFHFAAEGFCDAVICMYHDQGLIPLKLLHFDDGVNVTLGLPIVRTSVDHGTAYDIAGTGKASPASLVAAVRLAERMAGQTGAR